MLQLHPITTASAAHYAYMEQLLQSAFPADEYRDLQAFRDFTDNNPLFHNNILLHHDTPIGILTYWDFDTFCYVEHFAIDPALRNAGWGACALALLKARLQRPIVLEVELPVDELTHRRVSFYQRQGFELWPNPYQQPPYRPTDAYLPMRIMAWGSLSSLHDFEQVKQRIYTEVYGCLP